MTHSTRPRIGILGLLLDAYKPLFPGIQEEQEGFVRRVLDELGDDVEAVFPGAATSRQSIEETVRGFEADGMDGIVILMLSYAPAQHVVRAARDTTLPIALALVQPDERVAFDIEERALTVNQGIHGAQDVANTLRRSGVSIEHFAGPRSALPVFVRDFGAVARARSRARRMRIGAIGALPGMGDILIDELALMRDLGPHVTRHAVGELHPFLANLSEEEVDAVVERDGAAFDVDPALAGADHRDAVRLHLALRAWLEHNGLHGYTAHYEDFGADGRFRQLPLLAASHLLAEGYGYAAEGDVMAAVLVTTFIDLFGEADFSEMYMMDLENDAILFCHAGEGNWRMAAQRPRLIDRVLTEGGLENPPTPIFTLRPGRATVASLVHDGADRWRLVCASGDMLERADLTRCEMPYFFFRPDAGAAATAEGWLRAGGAHHQAVVLGEQRARLEMWCRVNDVELVTV
ncbi:hypothetical protein ACFWHT_01425 [Microbacterium sp. NPDC058342]|uniref:L-arabinose isomerase family protein n=1 Tax=Microbacterium sp. NPDC058342 TaxID=3346454 RepID=UPI00364AD0FD